jgi:hypothetical protein
MAELFRKYLKGECSAEELNHLFDQWNLPGQEQELRSLLREALDGNKSDDSRLDELIGSVDNRIMQDIRSWKNDAAKSHSVNQVHSKWLWLLSSAAALLLIPFSIFIWQYKSDRGIVEDRKYGYQNDILPAKNQASLIMADGNTISLAAGSDLPHGQGSGMNNLQVPKGGMYKLTLSDGTQVWLNALSKLRYPASFETNDRTVFLEGEAFFDVTKDASRPFRVVAAGKTIEVLGTSFNINAYKEKMQATLVEGRIKIINRGRHSFLEPGQEATITDESTSVVAVDVAPSIAWKNGDFYFNEEDLKDIMDEISRWYDIQLSYPGKLPSGKYTGAISRNATLAEVLEMLKDVTALSFEIENRTLSIKTDQDLQTLKRNR